MKNPIRLRNMFIATILATTLAGVGVAAQGRQPSTTQAVGTLRVDGITPSPTPLYAINFSVTQSTTDPGGGGGGAGKAQFSEFAVARLPDSASPLLFKTTATGQHIKEVQIDVLRTGSNTVDSTYILSDVLISSFSTDAALERVSFSYSKIEILSGTGKACYNLVTNTTTC